MLSVELIFTMWLPCLVMYMFEREAKQAFLAHVGEGGQAGQPHRQQHRLVNAHLTIYLAAGVALLVLNDLLVDAVHELGLAPDLGSAGGL